LLDIDWNRISRALCVLGLPIALAGPAFAVPVALDGETAEFCQSGYPIDLAFDGSLNSSEGWAVDPQEGSSHVAVVKSPTDLGAGPGARLAFALDMFWGGSHMIGRFRLSATTSDRSTYGQGATCGDPNPEGSANWTVLIPQSLGSANGQTLTVQPDGSVLASGTNPGGDRVTFVVTTPLVGITGFRLEALTDNSLPFNGPGRADNGNFVLNELRLDAESLAGVPTLDAWAMTLTALLLAALGLRRLRRRRA
jgi:hypothetical protein